MSSLLKIITLSFCIVVTGCVKPTEYGRSVSGGYGYTDRKIGPNKYELQVTGNSKTSHKILTSYFIRRAEALCFPKGYTSIVTEDKASQFYDGDPSLYTYTHKIEFPLLSGEVTCK